MRRFTREDWRRSLALAVVAVASLHARSSRGASGDEQGAPIAPNVAPIVRPAELREAPPEAPTPPTPILVDTRGFLQAMGGLATGGGVGAVGGRLGTTFSNRLSLAASVTYQAGGRDAAGFVYVGPELGFDITPRYLVVRPYVGGGWGFITSVPVQPSGGTVASVEAPSPLFLLWVGAQTTYDIPRTPLFLVADLRLVAVSGSGGVGAVFAGAGVKFGS